MNKLKLDSTIEVGEYKGTIVSEIANDKKAIFGLLRSGVLFDDDVLLKAGIKRNVRDIKTETVVTEHEKDTRIYEKENASLQKILKEINEIREEDEAVSEEELIY